MFTLSVILHVSSSSKTVSDILMGGATDRDPLRSLSWLESSRRQHYLSTEKHRDEILMMGLDSL